MEYDIWENGWQAFSGTSHQGGGYLMFMVHVRGTGFGVRRTAVGAYILDTML